MTAARYNPRCNAGTALVARRHIDLKRVCSCSCLP
ncbi:Ms4527A family Cys-rich leader peptide [Mycobacterium heidelbergense]